MRILGYVTLALLTATVMVVLSITMLGLWFLAIVLVFIPRLLKRAPEREYVDAFKPTDEDLHAWIEGRRD